MNYNNKILIKKKQNLIKDSYNIIEKIGSGSFGDIYLAQKKNIPYLNLAAKIEERKSKERVLNEYKIYRRLNTSGLVNGIPKIYELIQTEDYNIMFMELLDSSLEDQYNKSGRDFNLNTVLKIGIDILKLIKNVHNHGYIHRDIKPNNFMINLNKNKIYIMDFGLSKKYIKL